MLISIMRDDVIAKQEREDTLSQLSPSTEIKLPWMKIVLLYCLLAPTLALIGYLATRYIPHSLISNNSTRSNTSLMSDWFGSFLVIGLIAQYATNFLKFEQAIMRKVLQFLSLSLLFVGLIWSVYVGFSSLVI